MDQGTQTPMGAPHARLVAAGADRFGEHYGLGGISSINIKISAQESGGLFLLENIFRGKGGPARHLHTAQDEWFYVVEGTFVFEVGDEHFRLKPGDSLFAPRMVPHVWAHTGEGTGRILVAFNPAGKMEAFFHEVMQASPAPPKDPAVWQAYGMELLGPPLKIDDAPAAAG